ncbi:MAG: sigma-54-dependent Fis family transcriptional regulator [Chromatiaceae bacterium]|nr:sigma-54-dependent Fis family transcriptional regulator [Gammaproteobacteria bacterium]MCP5300796.1 sigma-54-dependent Fis family transcriptional regulator [Chromatiaceae bacterium]MCP5422868.1 sigma-54-dependent Fis family transcriptional regulator [Chromatiaceae bacterium]
MSRKLLIIEDDPALSQMLALHFADRRFDVQQADNCADGLAHATDARFDLILLDQQLPDGLGIDLLPRLLGAHPEAPVIMMTGQHDLELAIDAIKAGARDFIHKPLKTDALQLTVDKVLAAGDAGSEPATGAQPAPVRDLVGRSAAMIAVSKQIALCAGNSANVLISGESGTGKEIVARLIHAHSGRRGAFVAVNCAAIVDTLLESELFGHEKGAFTGADRAKPGKFERADDGTLFLDEIAELAPALQAKLLRALQERTIERVGGTRSIAVSARIVAATHRDLFARAREGRFREDLAYRLNVIDIELPPLRERAEDIPLLAQALLERSARQHGQALPTLGRDALALLQRHDWPGNVRELENVLTQAMVFARDGRIAAGHIRLKGRPPGDRAPPTGADDRPLASLDEVEAAHIQRVLDHTGGHKGRSCEILGISRPALDRKIDKYRLTLPPRG